MPTEPSPTDPPPAEQAERRDRMTSTIEALNARIAQLAKGLDLTLQNDSDVARVLSRRQTSIAVPHERRVNSDSRESRMWEELRGMLVLRYGLETRYVDQVGATATNRILIEAEQHMVGKGFKFGDDGIGVDLNHLLKQP